MTIIKFSNEIKLKTFWHQSKKNFLNQTFFKKKTKFNKSKLSYTYKLNDKLSIIIYKIGSVYKNGSNKIKKNLEKSFKYYQIAANQKNIEAQYALADCYYKGEGIRGSLHKAIKYYQMAADRGHVLSQYSLGCCFETFTRNKKSKQDAFNYFKLAADQNYAPAQYKLGNCYQQGYLPKESLNKAKIYYQLASQQGYALANKALTNLEQLRNLKKLAYQGYVNAQLQLGKFYHKGKYVRKSIAEACKWYQLAAKQGNTQAQYLTGECYRKGGLDLKESWETALMYYKLAANQGHILSIKFLISCYRYGIKVDESYEQALIYINLGAQLDDPECQFYLGAYYESGLCGLQPDISRAFKCYQHAANQGYAQALKRLKPNPFLLHPNALRINIQPHSKDYIFNLKKIFTTYKNYPIFLEKTHFSEEEALIIRNAMIENPSFTFMTSKDNFLRLLATFELIGYGEDDLKHDWLINPSTQHITYGCVFLENNAKNS